MNISAKQEKLRKKVNEPWHGHQAFARLRREATQYVPGAGNLDALIMVVGEAPGEEEDREGKPFVGPAGQILRDMLIVASVDWMQCWRTNLVKYRPVTRDGFNRQPTWNERHYAIRYLAREMDVISPWLVILCGRIAYNAVKSSGGITQARGRPFTMPGSRGKRIYLPIFHPAACLRDPESEKLTRHDLAVLVPAIMDDTGLSRANRLAVPGTLAEVIEH